MAADDAKRDRNRVTAAMAESDVSGEIRALLVDETTGRLKVDTTGVGTGTQYTDGDVDATATGTLALGQQSDDTLTPVLVNSSGRLQVDVISGVSGTEYTDGDADATSTGIAVMGTDGTNVRTITVDSSGDLQVDILSSALPSGAATSAKQDTIIGHIDGIETLLGTIDADTSILSAAVTSSKVQVDVITVPTTNTESDGTALSNNQISVDSTIGGTTILAASAGRQGAVITNQGTVNCYIGTGSVSTSNGFLLAAGESIALPTDSDIKGITASSSTTIAYLAFA